MTMKGTLVICRNSAYMMEIPQIIAMKALGGLPYTVSCKALYLQVGTRKMHE